MENFLNNSWVRNLLIPAVVFCLFFFISVPLSNTLFRLLRKVSEKTGTAWGEKIDYGFHKPLHAILVVAGVFIALNVCPVVWQVAGVQAFLTRTFRSFLVIAVAWGFCRMAEKVDLTANMFTEKLDFQVDKAVQPVLASVLRFLIIALAVLIIAQEWNFSISGLLAGLGLGGLAFALAAKDMLANLFGGLVILMDHPFAIGDWIRIGDVEGAVEDLNFRSLKIRTLTQELVTMPNSTVAASPVINYSRRGRRRVDFTLTMTYGTSADQLHVCTKKIRSLLAESKDLEGGTASVALSSLGESGIDLTVFYYTKTTDLERFLHVREEIYYSILKILEQEKAELAYPTNTVVMQNN